MAGAGPSPIVSRLTHATFGLWFPFFRWMARTLPPEWVARLASATAERAIWAREPVREAILGNIAAVTGLPPSSRRVEEIALRMVSNHSRLWIDLLRFAGSPPGVARSLIAATEGTHRLHEAQDLGKGAVLLTAHVGNYEIGGLFLRAIGFRFSVVYAPDPSPVIERHRAESREAFGVGSIPVTSSLLSFVSVLRALERGEFVAIQGDYDFSGTGWTLPFFGRATSFPTGPFRIAASSGAPLLPVFVLREADGRYRTIVEEPIRVAETGRDGRDAAIGEALRKFVGLMERTIRAHPDQWFRFAPFWERGE